MRDSRSGSGRDSWAQFFTLTFGNRKRFVRFVIVLVILLAFVVLAGWLWGWPTTGGAALVLGLWGWLRRRFQR